MKKVALALAVSAALGAISTNALANDSDSGIYAGIETGSMGFDLGDMGSYSTTSVTLIGGYQLNESFGVEVAYGKGGDGTKKTYDGVDLTMKVDSYMGVYATAKQGLTENLSVKMKLGYMQTTLAMKASDSIETVSATSEDSSLAWSLGLDYALNSNVALNAGYNSIYNNDGSSIAGFGAGASYKF